MTPRPARAMRTLKLVVAYDGTPFVGWQRQADGVSIQGAIEQALRPLEGSPVTVVGAGRTDAGVHAAGQVASVIVSFTHDPATVRRALNAVLPREIRVLRVSEAAAGFHARFAARAKTYEYRVLHAPVASPFAERYAWQVNGRLDVDAMRDAAHRLVGEHDFRCFQSTGSDVRDTTRRLLESDLQTRALDAASPVVPEPAIQDGRLLVYRVTGTGFLRHMVRAIVGTLIEIGAGREAPDLIDTLLAGSVRSVAGPTAPPQGLCLMRVHYDGV